ncbi:hypothetical protein BMW24_018280 [Mycobacterium heckeshornense]|uniref:Uncharacterized protein n=1 Tax=Mycobacterium heckeshornense TaxID=110505 RepID=A0A2G8B4C2_9MYCO|nr:hypothetical protein [Mycobacterium heckeshornense]MCV7034195.1 hypothetical protein [Mycobacterium heckeshornense]PIJ32599.1 hypothetical protein BMW24_018280 [Mycobacterium heckeshornense]BCO36848.1 hypothetical protein MHEC_32810 [Mycobacterium heckeshornense]
MIDRELDATLLIDSRRSTHLCDVGAPGFLAVAAVGSDGDTTLLVADADRLGDPTAGFDSACRAVEHEQLGALPPYWRSRVRLAPTRCGRATAAGGRCRVVVTRPGQTCGWHRSGGREKLQHQRKKGER